MKKTFKWKYQKIDPNITYEEYKRIYMARTWIGQFTDISGNIKL